MTVGPTTVYGQARQQLPNLNKDKVQFRQEELVLLVHLRQGRSADNQPHDVRLDAYKRSKVFSDC